MTSIQLITAATFVGAAITGLIILAIALAVRKGVKHRKVFDTELVSLHSDLWGRMRVQVVRFDGQYLDLRKSADTNYVLHLDVQGFESYSVMPSTVTINLKRYANFTLTAVNTEMVQALVGVLDELKIPEVGVNRRGVKDAK